MVRYKSVRCGVCNDLCFLFPALTFSVLSSLFQVYLIGRGNVKFANKNYNTLKNDYEVSLERNPLVQLTEDDGSIPFNNFKFVDISDLREHRKDEMIDMIGAVLEVGSLEDFTSKAGNRLQKRVIKVADASNVQVMVTLWGDQAAQWNHDVRGTVILFKGVKVSDFNDRSITVLRSTKMEVEPHIPEADRVRNWFETVGKDGDVPSISNTDFMSRARGDGSGGERSNWEESRKTFAQIKKETVGKEGNAYFSVRATVTGTALDNCPSMFLSHAHPLSATMQRLSKAEIIHRGMKPALSRVATRR